MQKKRREYRKAVCSQLSIYNSGDTRGRTRFGTKYKRRVDGEEKERALLIFFFLLLLLLPVKERSFLTQLLLRQHRPVNFFFFCSATEAAGSLMTVIHFLRQAVISLLPAKKKMASCTNERHQQTHRAALSSPTGKPAFVHTPRDINWCCCARISPRLLFSLLMFFFPPFLDICAMLSLHGVLSLECRNALELEAHRKNNNYTQTASKDDQH